LAAEDLNSRGGITAGEHKGRRIEVNCVDNQDSADVTATVASQYIADRDTWTLFGFYSSGTAQAAAIQAARAHLSVIGSNVAAEFLTTKSDNVVVRTPRLSSFGYAWVDFCKAYYGASRIGDLSPDFSYIAEYRTGRDRALGEVPGVRLVGQETYPGGTTKDFSPYLTKLRNSDADCLLVGSYPPEQCEIASQARSQGVTAPIADFSASGTGPSCVKAGGTAYTGLVFAQYLPLPPPPGSLLEQVGARYKQKYGEEMNGYAAYSYDSVLLAAQAIADGAKTREQLLDHIAKVDIPGLAGQLKFTDDLRPVERTFTILEATATGTLDPLAQYRMHPDGTAERQSVANCSTRPSCQLNLSR
jgi:branched-chain amino acid transport system substrate-binding protein